MPNKREERCQEKDPKEEPDAVKCDGINRGKPELHPRSHETAATLRTYGGMNCRDSVWSKLAHWVNSPKFAAFSSMSCCGISCCERTKGGIAFRQWRTISAEVA